MTTALIILLTVATLSLAVKIISMRRSVGEIITSLDEILSDDTNTVISLSSGDRSLRRLTSVLNGELKRLRALRLKYQNGDREVKDAVTNISHDLRTPLTAVCGYLQLLRREEKSETANRYLLQIENRTEAMKKLTEELFRYSLVLSSDCPDGLKTETLNVAAVLEETIAGFYGALTEKGIVPEISITEEKTLRRLNREALSRIYGNIIGNALKYSPGDLSISLDSSGTAEFKNSAPDLGEIEVGRLFDRFFSVERASNSTGLGLAIAKALTEQMGGSVSAELADGVLTIRVEFKADNADI